MSNKILAILVIFFIGITTSSIMVLGQQPEMTVVIDNPRPDSNIFDIDEIKPGDNFSVSGHLIRTNNQTPVSDYNLTVRILQLINSSKNVTTDSEGYFNCSFLLPTTPGNYSIEITGDQNVNLIMTYILIIQPPSYDSVWTFLPCQALIVFLVIFIIYLFFYRKFHKKIPPSKD